MATFWQDIPVYIDSSGEPWNPVRFGREQIDFAVLANHHLLGFSPCCVVTYFHL